MYFIVLNCVVRHNNSGCCCQNIYPRSSAQLVAAGPAGIPGCTASCQSDPLCHAAIIIGSTRPDVADQCQVDKKAVAGRACVSIPHPPSHPTLFLPLPRPDQQPACTYLPPLAHRVFLSLCVFVRASLSLSLSLARALSRSLSLSLARSLQCIHKHHMDSLSGGAENDGLTTIDMGTSAGNGSCQCANHGYDKPCDRPVPAGCLMYAGKGSGVFGPCSAAAPPPPPPPPYELHRPIYHLTPLQGHNNDPNGMFYDAV